MRDFIVDNAEKIGNGILWVGLAILAALGAKRGHTVAKQAGDNPPVAVAGDVLVIKSLEGLMAELGATQGTLVALRQTVAGQGALLAELLAENNRRIERNTVAIEDHRGIASENAKAGRLLADRAERVAQELHDMREETKDLRERNATLAAQIERLRDALAIRPG